MDLAVRLHACSAFVYPLAFSDVRVDTIEMRRRLSAYGNARAHTGSERRALRIQRSSLCAR